MNGAIDLDAYEDEYDTGDQRQRDRQRSEAARQRIDEVRDVATVLATHRGEVVVLLDGEQRPATYGGAMRGQRVVVGDRVRVDRSGGDDVPVRMLAVLDRETWLARADDDGGGERLVVTNMDRVAVVAGADTLGAGLRLLDRVLVSASLGGLATALVVTRLDLAERESLEPLVADLANHVVSVGWTSPVTGIGLDEVRSQLADGWSALVGHSGVGKSTLVNALVPGLERRVGVVGPRGGRHTTVTALAARMGDGWVVDTPGVRSFGVAGVAADDLWRHWPGLADLACEGPSCMHVGETGCVADDVLSPARLGRYREVRASLAAAGDR